MLRLEGETLSLSGAVTAKTYRALRDGAASYVGPANLVVDWSAVTEVDSSAVALILYWQREANHRGGAVANAEMPESLNALIDLYGLSTVLNKLA